MRLVSMRWPASLVARSVVVFLLLGLVGGLGAIVAWRLTALPADAAFRVGDTVVTEDEYQQKADVLEALYGIKPPDSETANDEYRRQTARAIVLGMVFEQAGRARGIVISEEAARDHLAKSIEQGFPNGRQGFAELLGNAGASEADVLTAIKLQMTVGRLFHDVTADPLPKITEAMLREYYQRHTDQFTRPETRRVRNIVVASREDAEKVLGGVRSGMDMAELARTYSLDASSRDSGGDLGFVSREQLEPGYADATFSASPGKPFGPVKTTSGWNVGEVVGIRPGERLSFEDVEDKVRAEVLRQRAFERWREWVAERLRTADVDYADEYRPSNTELVGQHPGASP